MSLRRKSGERASARLPGQFLLVTLGSTLLLAGLSPRLLAQTQSASQSSSQSAWLLTPNLPPGSADIGKALFSGTVRFHNGGPPCAACHSIAGLPFPNGGTLGPNLTGVYHKLGPHGMQTAMKTLYFHVMTAVYAPHPLTLGERADLVAFFKEASANKAAHGNTQIVALIAVIGFLILLAITHFVWRDRLKSVRRRMVERALGEGRSYS
ncbi:MAG TPA: cytochrome c [Terriglobia bacterium]|nr:cytochrome c [Terriglobia bacterium]